MISRYPQFSAGVLVAALLSARSLASEAPSGATLPTLTGPVACFFEPLESQVGRGSSAEDVHDSPVNYVVSTLSSEESAQWAEQLDSLANEIAAKANPLFVDLEDPAESEISLLDPIKSRWLPALTAATNLVSREHWLADRSFGIRLSAACKGEACRSLWDEANGVRTQFLAWPLAFAAMLGVDDRHDRVRLRQALVSKGDTRFSLVLGGASTSNHEDLVASAKRLQALLLKAHVEMPPALAALSGANEGQERISPSCAPRENEIWVIPKLHTLSELPLFLDSIDETLSQVSAKVYWIRRPQPPSKRLR